MTHRRVTVALIAANLLAGSIQLGGCAPKRYVTKTHWHDGDSLLVAYRKVTGTVDEGRVKLCRRRADNSLKCAPVNPVNELLSPPRED